MASLALIGSGAIRSFQSSYYDEAGTYDIACPFPLKQIPRTLDGWHMVEGSEAVLDPLTTRITGSTDHITRNYVNEMTGVTLSVLVLYGPAEPGGAAHPRSLLPVEWVQDGGSGC